jgi:hypothetical protein
MAQIPTTNLLLTTPKNQQINKSTNQQINKSTNQQINKKQINIFQIMNPIQHFSNHEPNSTCKHYPSTGSGAQASANGGQRPGE